MSTRNHATPPERPGSPRSRRDLAGRLMLPVLLAAAFILWTRLLDGGLFVAPGTVTEQPFYIFANALPGLLLAVLLLVLCRRPWFSFGISFLLQALIYGINRLKVLNLGIPLMPADFRMVGQLRKGGAHLLGGYLPTSPWPYLAIAAALVVVWLAARYEPPLFPRRTGGKRLIGAGLLTAGLGSLLAGVPLWAKFYDQQHLWMAPWSASATADRTGLVNSLMLYHLQFNQAKAKPDAALASRLLAQHDGELRQRMTENHARDEGAPDIVVVQSESFFDPAIMRGYENNDFTPNLRRLAAEGSSGPLHVPTYGGATIRTEFEVLTGLSLRYFGDMQFPYLQMGNKVMPGMVRTLRAHGYRTVAVHGNDPGFWNRDSAFKSIGFDSFVSRSAFPAHAPVDGKYMADRAMTDEIMAQLKDSGQPQFVFAISIEAHGPYDDSPGIDTAQRDAIPVPEGVNGKAKLEMQNYIYHIRHADQELGRLAELLAKRERPTLLMFYGDHLPGLTDAFKVNGFVDGRDMLSQSGTWLLVNPRNPAPAPRQALAAWMLPGKLLEQAGIHDDTYFALTQLLGPQLADLTRAPGAAPEPTDRNARQTDQGMASIAMLQMKKKLLRLLPNNEPLPSETGIARDRSPMPAAVESGVRQ